MIGNVMALLTLLLVILFLVWYFRTKEPEYVGVRLKRQKKISKPMGLWKPMSIQEILADIDPEKRGSISGNLNKPPADALPFTKTEKAIISKVENHVDQQLHKVTNKGFKANEANEEIEEVFEDLENIIEAPNGYDSEYSRMKQDWRNKRSAFEDRIEESVNELRQANQDYENFVEENKIEINRTPHKPNKFLKLIKILIPVVLFMIEISLNFDALKDTTGLAQARYLSFTVAAINVGLSFLLGYLVITHLLNKVQTSKSPRFLFYGFWVFAYGIVMLWLNLMLGVFRSLTNKSAEATTQILEKQAIDKAFNDSVYPFNSIGEITFDGAFLLFMGLFFALITMIDGYFFRDPIPGYQSIGDRVLKAQARVQKLINHDRVWFGIWQSRYEQDLDTTHQNRVISIKEWRKYVNVVQQLDEDFKDFIEQNKNALKLGLNKYRAANEYLRTKPAPSYFKDEYTSLFSAFTFKEKYGSVDEYNITDDVKRSTAKKWRETAFQDINKMQSQYEKFFDDQRVDLDAYVKALIKELNGDDNLGLSLTRTS